MGSIGSNEINFNINWHIKGQFLDPKTDPLSEFLSPETNIMGERVMI